MNEKIDTKQHEGKRDIASSVLNRIEREAIVPVPKWHYIFREGVVWSLGGVAVVLGALSVAAILFTGSYSDWEYYSATHETLTAFALDIMPYTWLIALALFGVAAYVSVRHTKRGYRYSLPSLMIGAIGLSAVLGSGLYGAGAGRFVDEEIGRAIPLHRTLQETKLGFWNQPENGIIAGVVKEIRDDGTLTLRTPQGEEEISLATLDETLRSEIEVGSALRVLAPRIYTERVASAPSAAASAPVSSDADATMMMSTSLEAPAGTMAKGMAAPAMMREMSDEREEAMDEVRELREACLVIPLDWDRGFRKSREKSESDSRKDRMEMREECLEELRELREDRVKDRGRDGNEEESEDDD